MLYKISVNDPKSHFIEIEAVLSDNIAAEIEVQLPAWRPGRYELQNFAKNLQYFRAYAADGSPLPCQKLTKDRWRVSNAGPQVTFRYRYYANEQNAGSCYSDDKMLYINPVNCCVYVEGRIDEPCEMHVMSGEELPLAGGIRPTYADGRFILPAKDFYHLADSPFMLSASLQMQSYEVNGIVFSLWVAGNYQLDWETVLRDFKKFTAEQLAVFGEFPENDYHFLLWVLPTPYYHGVEHRNSTMMVLGPDIQPFAEMYVDLLGLASHELFHAWNICRIRPKELLPYDYTRENYFRTCFVAEGITTFYGDWMLYRSGVFSDEAYQKELELYYRRHFETADNAQQSLLESSFDLWLDGYSRGIPDRKVSVYHKGAIVSQLLQHLLSQKGKSLDDVMRLLWQQYGKPFVGYTYEDYIASCETVYGGSLQSYFAKCIEGTESLWPDVVSLMDGQNLELSRNEEGNVSLKEKT